MPGSPVSGEVAGGRGRSLEIIECAKFCAILTYCFNPKIIKDHPGGPPPLREGLHINSSFHISIRPPHKWGFGVLGFWGFGFRV